MPSFLERSLELEYPQFRCSWWVGLRASLQWQHNGSFGLPPAADDRSSFPALSLLAILLRRLSLHEGIPSRGWWVGKLGDEI